MNLNYDELLPLIAMYASCGSVCYQCEDQAKTDPVLGAIVNMLASRVNRESRPAKSVIMLTCRAKCTICLFLHEFEMFAV